MKLNGFRTVLSALAVANVAAPLAFAQPTEADDGKTLVPSQVIHIAHPMEENSMLADVHIVSFTDADGRLVKVEPSKYTPGQANGLSEQFTVLVTPREGPTTVCDATEYQGGRIAGTKTIIGKDEVLELQVPSKFIDYIQPVLAGIKQTFTNIKTVDQLNKNTAEKISSAADECLKATTLVPKQAHYSPPTIKYRGNAEQSEPKSIMYWRHAERIQHTHEVAVMRPQKLPPGVISDWFGHDVKLVVG